MPIKARTYVFWFLFALVCLLGLAVHTGNRWVLLYLGLFIILLFAFISWTFVEIYGRSKERWLQLLYQQDQRDRHRRKGQAPLPARRREAQ